MVVSKNRVTHFNIFHENPFVIHYSLVVATDPYNRIYLLISKYSVRNLICTFTLRRRISRPYCHSTGRYLCNNNAARSSTKDFNLLVCILLSSSQRWENARNEVMEEVHFVCMDFTCKSTEIFHRARVSSKILILLFNLKNFSHSVLSTCDCMVLWISNLAILHLWYFKYILSYSRAGC